MTGGVGETFVEQCARVRTSAQQDVCTDFASCIFFGRVPQYATPQEVLCVDIVGRPPKIKFGEK
jgi:hypothetical protein